MLRKEYIICVFGKNIYKKLERSVWSSDWFDCYPSENEIEKFINEIKKNNIDVYYAKVEKRYVIPREGE